LEKIKIAQEQSLAEREESDEAEILNYLFLG
jgi:hypothetical protein